jgi:probable FeS assembly SUF system protein SufT
MRARENEPVVLCRDVRAVAVPAGIDVTLKAGAVGYITQALGGSFTVYIDGNLFRIAGENADALGKEVLQAPEVPANPTADDIRNIVWDQMRSVYDPEIPINIVDLGLVYECEVERHDDQTYDVRIMMTVTAPGCGMGEIIVADVKEKVERIPGVRGAQVDLVFDPPWNPSMMSDAARLQTGMM